MGKGPKSRCQSASHKLLKDKAKSRVDDLQGVFMDLQSARKESRSVDVVVLEEQVHQMLREWKAELDAQSPASSFQEDSLGSLNLSSDIRRLLQLCEEEDDATSPLTVPTNLKPEPGVYVHQEGEQAGFREDYCANQVQKECCLQQVSPCKSDPTVGVLPSGMNNLEPDTQLDHQQFDLHQDFSHNILGFDGTGDFGNDPMSMPDVSSFFTSVCPPPSAFLRPKCALWDCPRPAHGPEWYPDYCSSFHATLAMSEGLPGMAPVLRPSGIDLKDGPLFAALTAKTQQKDVGIPECEGAATTKSPWNAPELFDLSFLEGELIREWLFFDKPRRAFESGNRKQRSLPDYCGRGWHESRKQVLKEFGGLKRSYYMDPQPLKQLEWHLYEYEISDCNAWALYRLEFKQVDAKKSPKGKVPSDSVVDLQQQMGRLSAEFAADSKRAGKGRAKVISKESAGDACSAPNQAHPFNATDDYGTGVPQSYFFDTSNNNYGT
eukprot:TRINITY_DN4371_c0_g1_i5.p1 TRINITY_DN4371_c0_g1~~TRINITY_DN4371_c0_g1_i5.p1  ORF type:complete len:491 (+),score=110.07 TRINITY_DN4371_c0_g1_i5:212-1684(+)